MPTAPGYTWVPSFGPAARPLLSLSQLTHKTEHTMKKPPIAQRRAAQRQFHKDATDILVSYGWMPTVTFGYKYAKETPFGEFLATLHETDDSQIFSVYLRAMNPGLVALLVGRDMNPFSGKWNIHEYRPEVALKTLLDRITFLNERNNP